jgi:hypothetical protein
MGLVLLSHLSYSPVESSIVESVKVIDTLLFGSNFGAIRSSFGPRITAGLFRDFFISAVHFDIFDRPLISSGTFWETKKKY